MKILYHHRSLADGAEGIHIAAMVDAFTAMGHEVRVRGLAARPQDLRRRRTARAMRAMLPRWTFELVSAALNAAEYFEVTREIRLFAPDFIYKRHARFDVAALLAARDAGIPSVLELNALFTQGAYHDFEPLAMRSLAVRLERRALEIATVVLAVSTPLARQAETVVSRKVVVMPNGVNPKTFDPTKANAARVRVRCGLAADVTIGWTGILRGWHGLGLLLDAMAEVPGPRLLLVGDGPARQAIEARAEALGLGERVTITGRVPHEEVADYVAAMDIAVVADERTGVASPMKLLEYMAMGCAVVAPRLDNIRDLVTDGTQGLLFAAGQSRDLANVLQRLVADEPLRETLGRNARLTIERERNWHRNAERILALVGNEWAVCSDGIVSQSSRHGHV